MKVKKRVVNLRDQGDAEYSKSRLEATVDISKAAIEIALENHETYDCDDGCVVYLELFEGKPRLLVWADINSQEPTHTIDLSGAHKVHDRG